MNELGSFVSGTLTVFAVAFCGYAALCFAKGFIEGLRGTRGGAVAVPNADFDQNTTAQGAAFPIPQSALPSAADARWLRRNGWRFESHDSIRGRFRTSFCTIPGRITYSVADAEFRIFLHKPPEWLHDGSHGTCIWDRGNGWYLLHQYNSKAGFVETIISTEAFILRNYAETHGNTLLESAPGPQPIRGTAGPPLVARRFLP